MQQKLTGLEIFVQDLEDERVTALLTAGFLRLFTQPRELYCCYYY